MTNGVGGSRQDEALERISPSAIKVDEISTAEYLGRINSLQQAMLNAGVDAVYVNAGTNLLYFSGIEWHPSERLLGTIIPAKGNLIYIAPWFEKRTLCDRMKIAGDVVGWHEDESAYEAFYRTLRAIGIAPTRETQAKIALCGTASTSVYFGLKAFAENYDLVSAEGLIVTLRKNKSPGEIALMQAVKNMTLQVQAAAASILRAGISTLEVCDFIDRAHRKSGAPGSYFCIVLFGEATSYPHGVKEPQILKPNDVVLIDTGCRYKNYISDITRTYVFGEANDRQRFVWNAEKSAQAAAFEVAQLGVPCSAVDRAARRCLEIYGFGPAYQLPGLPHRTGHGIGLDIHEAPYLVGNDETPLEIGMCFSNEPMICIPGEFGVRHEDHFYMTEHGPKWFTQPAYSIDDPFLLV